MSELFTCSNMLMGIILSEMKEKREGGSLDRIRKK